MTHLILWSFAPTQENVDGVLNLCSCVCTSWRAVVKGMTQQMDTWMQPYHLRVDACLLRMPKMRMQLKEMHVDVALQLELQVCNFNHDPDTFMDEHSRLSLSFRSSVLRVTEVYERTVADVVLAMKMHWLRRDVQMMGIAQLLQLTELEDLSLLHGRVFEYDNMAVPVFSPVEDVVLNVMRTHGDAEAQTSCMELLNMMEWAGFVSKRESWEHVTPLFVHAMEAYPDDAVLVRHGCYVLFRGCNAPGHSEGMNARCITAVLSALSLFPQDSAVVYAGFAALTPLFWAHTHGKSTVRGIETVLQCMQVQAMDLQTRIAADLDARNNTVYRQVDSAKILFAGLDVLCKLLHVDKNPFKRHSVPSYKSVFPTLQGFGVVRVAHALLLLLGAGLGPWDTYCDDARTFPELLSL